MAKFFGKVGYGISTLTAPGVWEDLVVEQQYYGDVIRNSRQLREGSRAFRKVNSDVEAGNTISIVADAYANKHFFAIRYVEWAGTLWIVQDVTVESPRLLLQLGGVYHGPKASASSTP